MPRFEPFRALRFADRDLQPLLAPPYDVLDDSDVDALQARSAHNVTFVDVPRGGADRYEVAAATLQDWVDQGVLVLDPEPSFTIYRLRFTDASGSRRDVAGVLGALEVLDPGADSGAGRVLPHERTTPKDSTDRLELTRATRANLSPVWGLSLAAGLAAMLAEPGEPVGRLVELTEGLGGPEVVHVWERVTDPERVRAIGALLAADDVLIADGHHRYAVSRTYRDEVRAATGRDDTGAERTLAFVAELVADQLSVEPIHRHYSGVDLAELRAALERFFVLSRVGGDHGTVSALNATAMVLLTVEGAWRLDPRPGVFDDVRALDGLWLETALEGVDVQVAYQDGVDAALDAVADRVAVAAVLVRPPSLEEIQRTAREGLLMPPKSTFFTPKLKTGAVLRPLEP
ncbi:DUF1015 family protein [Microlunatus flavus]|uniref:Uncharacterized conserved protein, DUF1015 family n=1 Tax=Microlunatus flavus TaxID=1036181 RepID=A0A1H9F7E2_9ACTN|nr:DUF1015 domain-containing protein [Microlunatus flavus]SEQ33870.1 Uncharacterized conserved protein, DUF1015 family [Microlunatus flavus]